MKRRKPANTAARRQLAADWDALTSKWESVQSFSRGAPPASKPKDASYKLSGSPRGSTQHIPSRVTPGHSTAKHKDVTYTGGRMVGIATLHKSVAVPVFSAEDAIDISKMRR